jgi:hypothetical protein
MSRELTAREHEEILKKDPKYQAMMAEKERQWAERSEVLRRDEQPLLAALAAAGWPESVRQCGNHRSVWDLVNTAESYPQLLETLADHLTKPYNPSTLDGIARALTVREARGTRIPRVIMDQLKKQTNPSDGPSDGYRFSLINALVLIGDASMSEEARQLIEDPRFATVRVDLKRLAKALRRAGR